MTHSLSWKRTNSSHFSFLSSHCPPVNGRHLCFFLFEGILVLVRISGVYLILFCFSSIDLGFFFISAPDHLFSFCTSIYLFSSVIYSDNVRCVFLSLSSFSSHHLDRISRNQHSFSSLLDLSSFQTTILDLGFVWFELFLPSWEAKTGVLIETLLEKSLENSTNLQMVVGYEIGKGTWMETS